MNIVYYSFLTNSFAIRYGLRYCFGAILGGV
jgi:hypothetical protein